jgi:acyl-CoA thioester hydrolase
VGERPNFSFMCRVYWEDTDAGGVVYYANYLKFMERCRTEWLRRIGIDQHRLRLERGLQFAIVNVSIEYLRPAVLDDELQVTAELEKLGGATFEFRQAAWRGAELLATSAVRVACLDSKTLKARQIPKDLFAEWRNAG